MELNEGSSKVQIKSLITKALTNIYYKQKKWYPMLNLNIHKSN